MHRSRAGLIAKPKNLSYKHFIIIILDAIFKVKQRQISLAYELS